MAFLSLKICDGGRKHDERRQGHAPSIRNKQVRAVLSPGELAAILKRAAAKAEVGTRRPTEALMTIVEQKAKEVIGTYEYGWPPLAESTLANKTTGDSPLLETGALRDSIQHRAEPTATGAEGLVYRGALTGLWAEMGTSGASRRDRFSCSRLSDPSQRWHASSASLPRKY